MRGALIVGVDYYENINQLYGCVSDAYSIKNVLERHDGGDINFECKILTSSNQSNQLKRSDLKDAIEDLFTRELDVALFYFAGHGYIESSGGYILASDAERGDEGVSLSDILLFANESPSKNKLIILDSCHSGIMGDKQGEVSANLAEGVTVLTASTKEQYATEIDGRGLYTTLLVDALNGSAANLTGDVTPGSVYSHIDQSLGAFEQRPVFKTNVKEFISLKKITPPIPKQDLRRILEFFPEPGIEFNLDPTYEPELRGRKENDPPPIEKNTVVFELLQKYNRLGLLNPVGTDHMWNAAMESKSCKLTILGEHYRRLAEKNRI